VARVVRGESPTDAHDDARHDGHGHAGPGTQRRALWVALLANAGFLVVEVVGGLAFHSLALLADATHMLSDVVGLGVALIAQRLAQRPASAAHSYGMQRAEVLGAQANGIALLAVAAWIIYESVHRLGNRVHVDGAGLLLVATAGLAVNVGSAVVLRRSQGRSLNMRGAFAHMVADAAASVGAIAAGVAVVAWDVTWADPAVSLLLSGLVIWAGWGLLRDTTHVLLEGVPKGLDPTSVTDSLSEDPEVELVHHLHLWNLASDVPALSAHVVLRGEPSLHEAQASGDRLRTMLAARFGVEHATLELECHPCDDPDHESSP
jgi:cobalt-zinc-cadmium efflux system protein